MEGQLSVGFTSSSVDLTVGFSFTPWYQDTGITVQLQMAALYRCHHECAMLWFAADHLRSCGFYTLACPSWQRGKTCQAAGKAVLFLLKDIAKSLYGFKKPLKTLTATLWKEYVCQVLVYTVWRDTSKLTSLEYLTAAVVCWTRSVGLDLTHKRLDSSDVLAWYQPHS